MEFDRLRTSLTSMLLAGSITRRIQDSDRVTRTTYGVPCITRGRFRTGDAACQWPPNSSIFFSSSFKVQSYFFSLSPFLWWRWNESLILGSKIEISFCPTKVNRNEAREWCRTATAVRLVRILFHHDGFISLTDENDWLSFQFAFIFSFQKVDILTTVHLVSGFLQVRVKSAN